MSRTTVITLLLSLSMLACTPTDPSKTKKKVRIQGSTTVNPVMAQVSEVLRTKLGVKITVDTQGGSGAGVFTAGEGTADIGMSSKPLSDKDKKKFPDLKSHTIGYDAVALVVSASVYEGGVKSLSKEQIAGIFTGKLKSWKELGGPDTPIFIYNKEAGRGTRAVFDKYVFDTSAMDLPSMRNYAEVGGNEETRQKIESHGSAIGQLSATWAENRKKLRVIGLRDSAGAVILPTAKALRDRSYPMFRGLYLLTKGSPKAAIQKIIEYTLSKEGQKIVRRVGYLPVNDDA
jgi:phosphate transport system substrate-binding protein